MQYGPPSRNQASTFNPLLSLRDDVLAYALQLLLFQSSSEFKQSTPQVAGLIALSFNPLLSLRAGIFVLSSLRSLTFNPLLSLRICYDCGKEVDIGYFQSSSEFKLQVVLTQS